MDYKLIPTPSQLRREIIALVNLNIKSEQSDDLLLDQFTQIKFEMVDIVCSILQGSRQPSEAIPLAAKVQELLAGLRENSGLSMDQNRLLLEMTRFVEQIILIFQDPLLTGSLQEEKLPIPSQLQLTETVLMANGQLMAESFRLFLESFGIQAILGRESAGVVYGLTVGPLGEVDLKVAPEHVMDATILLDAMQRGCFALEDQPETEDSVTEDEEFSDDL